MEIKKTISKLSTNIIGTVAGAGAAFLAAKKYGNVHNKWALAALTVVGAVIGAGIEYKIRARTVKPAIAAQK